MGRKVKGRENEKFVSHVSVARLAVMKIEGDQKAAKQKWHDLSRELQLAANQFMRLWENWHMQNGSIQKIKSFLDAAKKDRGKLDIPRVPLKEHMSPTLYEQCAKAHPQVPTTMMALFTNELAKKLAGKSSGRQMQKWMAILLDLERKPQATRPQPIPVNPGACEIIKPNNPKEPWKLRLTIVRTEAATKAGNQKGINVSYVCHLRDKSKRFKTELGKLAKIHSGEFVLMGSKLVYDDFNREWVVMIAHRVPSKINNTLDESKIATLTPSLDCPFVLANGSEQRKLGGDGLHIARVRRTVWMQRRARQENYKWATKSKKGRGGKRARKSWEGRLRRRWDQFCSNVNNQIARETIDWCLRWRCKHLLYHQPENGYGDKMLLGNTGALPDNSGKRQAIEGWQWYAIGTKLKNAGEKVGVEVSIVKLSDPEDDVQKDV